MKFRKYSSIDNAYRTKTVHQIDIQGLAGGEWVSTVKVHGANYSLWYDGKTYARGKRSGFIGESDIFYGDVNLDYTQKIKNMYEYLCGNVDQEDHPLELRIVGEIYGGLYDHPEVDRDPTATRVQKEVSYRPDNGFIVFDIAVNGRFVDWETVKVLCFKFGFDHVVELARGKFNDLIKIPVVFPDPIGVMLGHPIIGGNDAEGWVLKPVENAFFGNGSRVILKGKNPKMSEKCKKFKPKKPVYTLTDDATVMYEELICYFNENRLRNVLSHGHDITQRDFGKLLGLLAKDGYDDFLKDNSEAWEKLDKKDQILIRKGMNRIAGDIIRPNFVNIIDGEF